MIAKLLSGPFAFIFRPIFLNILRHVQDGMIFKPNNPQAGNIRPIKSPWQYEGFKLRSVEEVSLTTSDGETLLAWFKRPENGKPTFLYFPGNTGHFGDCGCGLEDDGTIVEEGREYRLEAIEKMCGDGRGFLSVCYRGYATSTGKPSEKGLQNDAESAYEFLIENGISPENIIVYGDSLGGAVALKFLASIDKKLRPKILITTGTFASMADKGFDLFPQIEAYRFTPYLKHPYESSRYIRELTGMKIILIHGAEDSTTFPYHAEKLLNNANSAGVAASLISLEGVGHINIDSNLIVSTALNAYKETRPE